MKFSSEFFLAVRLKVMEVLGFKGNIRIWKNVNKITKLD